MVNISLPESIIPSTTTNYTRGHNLRLYLPFSRVNVYKHSFFPATMNLWNELPSLIANAPTINILF